MLEEYDQVLSLMQPDAVLTPLKTCEEMINRLDAVGFFDKPVLITKEYIDNHRVIDICCKSGNFLIAFYRKFSVALCNVVRSKPKRDELIWKHLLFSVNSKLAVYMALRAKIAYESGYGTYDNFIDRDLADDFESVQKLLDGWKFEVVVGNPPCDNDAYIDYILKGRQLSKRYMLMLAPLKFQSEEIDDCSEELRSLFSDSEFVTYYPVKSDEFPAEMPFDVCSFLMKIHS